MPFVFQNAQPRMWNKPSVHLCGRYWNLIIEAAMPDHRRYGNISGLETPGSRIQTCVGHGALDALAEPFPETVEQPDADPLRHDGTIRLRQVAKSQQHPGKHR